MANMVNITNFDYGEQTMEVGRNVRFVVMLTAGEARAIQDFRFAKRIATKAEAARTLIRKGLETEKSATTGSEFGDTSPVEAGNSNHQEMTDAKRT